MTEPGRRWDPAAVVPALEAMDVALFGGMARALGVEFVEAGDHAHTRCGLHGGGLNRVMAARLPPGDVGGAIARIMAPFRRQGLPVTWSLWPTARPEDIGAHLQRHGVGADADPPRPGMAVDLARLPAESPAPAGLELRPVADAETRGLWYDAASAVFGFPPALAEAFRRGPARPEAPASTESGPLAHVVAVRAGTAVAVASVVLAGDVAGLGWVGTVPAARRQGLGAAVTLAALREGRDRGCRIGGLWASPLGEGVYRRLGFQEVCPLRYYIWRPPAS
jgi:GNAT superfamily N-acetyltransferase